MLFNSDAYETRTLIIRFIIFFKGKIFLFLLNKGSDIIGEIIWAFTLNML